MRTHQFRLCIYIASAAAILLILVVLGHGEMGAEVSLGHAIASVMDILAHWSDD